MKLKEGKPDTLKVADQKGRILLGSKYAGKRFAVREEPDGTAVLVPVLIVPERDAPVTSQRLDESFAALEVLKDNWDDNGSLAPVPECVAYAREALALLQAGALARGVHWTEPHIGSNERGQVTLEWWREGRALTLFIRSGDQVDYLKAWGSNIASEMEDGTVERIADFIALSRWLYQAEAPKA